MRRPSEEGRSGGAEGWWEKGRCGRNDGRPYTTLTTTFERQGHCTAAAAAAAAASRLPHVSAGAGLAHHLRLHGPFDLTPVHGATAVSSPSLTAFVPHQRQPPFLAPTWPSLERVQLALTRRPHLSLALHHAPQTVHRNAAATSARQGRH